MAEKMANYNQASEMTQYNTSAMKYKPESITLNHCSLLKIMSV